MLQVEMLQASIQKSAPVKHDFEHMSSGNVQDKVVTDITAAGEGEVPLQVQRQKPDNKDDNLFHDSGEIGIQFINEDTKSNEIDGQQIVHDLELESPSSKHLQNTISERETPFKDVNEVESDLIKPTNVSHSVTEEGGLSEETPGPTGIRLAKNNQFNLHFSKVKFLRSLNRMRSRNATSHGQLVEEPCSPVNTLERNQTDFKECFEFGSDIRHRRSKMERLRSFGLRARRSLESFTTCVSRRRNVQREYSPSDATVKFQGTDVELPPDITAVSNENVHLELRPDSS